jgi:hypothetical protein
MSLDRSTAYLLVVVTATLSVAVHAYAVLWVAPRALGMSTSDAYEAFLPASVGGIKLFLVGWIAWSVVCTLLVAIGIGQGRAWMQGKQRRVLSLISSVLLIFGLVGTSSWLIFVEIDLAMEHVLPAEARATDSSALFVRLWLASAGAILVAVLLALAGGVLERRPEQPRPRDSTG